MRYIDGYSSNFGDEALKALVQNSPELHSVEILCPCLVTYEGWSYLLNKSRMLKILTVWDYFMSLDTRSSLRKIRPDVRISSGT